jgi:hypothetical protein
MALAYPKHENARHIYKLDLEFYSLSRILIRLQDNGVSYR